MKLTTKVKIDFLKTTKLCAGLELEELSKLAEKSSVIEIKSEKNLFEEGKESGFFYIIYSGFVKIEKHYTGKKPPLMITLLSRGDCFGEMGILHKEKNHTANAFCLSKTTVFKINEELFLNLYNENIRFVQNLLTIALVWLKNSNQHTKFALLSSRDSSYRVLFLFKFLTDKFIEQKVIKDDKIELILPFSDTELATFAGMLKGNFNRGKKKLIEENLIRDNKKGHYTICSYKEVCRVLAEA